MRTLERTRHGTERRFLHTSLATLPTPITHPHLLTRTLLWVCALAVPLALAEMWLPLPVVLLLGGVPVGAAAVPAVWLVARVARTWGRGSVDMTGALVSVVVVVTGAAALAGAGGGWSAVGLVAAAALEEGVFRVAVMLATVAAAHRTVPLTTPRRRARAWGLAVAVQALLFALLPGHLAQMPGIGPVGAAAGFVGTACLLAMITWVLRAPVAAVAAHAAFNVATFAVVANGVAGSVRVLAILAVVGPLLAADARATRAAVAEAVS